MLIKDTTKLGSLDSSMNMWLHYFIHFIFIFLHYFTAHFVILKYENYASKYFEFNALDLFYLGSNFTYTFMIFKFTYKLFLKEENFAHEL